MACPSQGLLSSIQIIGTRSGVRYCPYASFLQLGSVYLPSHHLTSHPSCTYVPMIAISESARAEVPHKLNFVGVVPHGLPMEQFRPTGRKRSDFFVWLGRFVPDK